ncbi:MAG: bifunctional proline dehydrogenase/L-glutamate gamma-semialdehyde dehydrogenase PutA [Alphaproteobacteria bacterium]
MFKTPNLIVNDNRKNMRNNHLVDEVSIVKKLYDEALFNDSDNKEIESFASDLIQNVRDNKSALTAVQSLMQEYALSDKEGIILMCLAESLLRIPDSYTANKLIKDKLQSGDFYSHAGNGYTWFVNASTWGLVLTGKVLKMNDAGWAGVFKDLTKKTSLPVIRTAVGQMMKILGKEFVLGETIESAINRADEMEQKGYRYSYDMLGEGALTKHDAIRYYNEYEKALNAIGSLENGKNIYDRAGISVKISAIHPRYEMLEHHRVMAEVVPDMLKLCKLAKQYNIGLFIDAEEMDRTDVSLDIVDALLSNAELDGWDGLGFVVQAYGKRAKYVIDDLYGMCKSYNRKMMVRLVKGAYWDTEIKRAQEMGLDDFPVFTRKEHTDVSYIACSKQLFKYNDLIYPCFATHNAHSVATVINIAENSTNAKYEFQKLHGMGDYMYSMVTESEKKIPTRIYAPVGNYKDLLPYLVRRLLENGANSSFVNRIFDEDIDIKDMVKSPMEVALENGFTKHEKVQYAKDITKPENDKQSWRDNAKGIDMTNINDLETIKKGMEDYSLNTNAFSIIDGIDINGEKVDVLSPQSNEKIATAHFVNEKTAKQGLESVAKGFNAWTKTSAEDRAVILEKTADIFEERMADFIKLTSLEAGKTILDGIAEVREAVDFLRYYANEARRIFVPTELPGPTGEKNIFELHGRGVFLCISPWNFPLAIFMGQIAGALSAGNTVVAKPAETTPLVAYEAVKVLLEAGLPKDAICLLQGHGKVVGDALLTDKNISGVAFTGSTETAQHINITLAGRTDGIIPFIAETGGQNAMIVDSSALLEQVSRDLITGAFQSAGQRCSATRVLYVQDDIADNLIKMLSGAMNELNIGDPINPATDVGPVIDNKALDILTNHKARMDKEAKKVGETPMNADCEKGTFFAPVMYEIDSINVLEREVFGPVLHIIRWKNEDLDKVIDEINNTGYGLTFGIHSRIDETIDYVVSRMRVGNAYVNRNQIGAMVGQQPFGGEGKSGTGFKAGGPNYLLRFCTEKTISIDTTAAGGNASLMAEV